MPHNELSGIAKRHNAGNGWDSCRLLSVEDHDLPTERFEAELGPLFDRMRERGAFPQVRRSFRFTGRTRPPYCNCTLTKWAATAANCIARFAGIGAGAFHPRYSRVLLIDGRVKGCILAHRVAADVAAVDADILDPKLRGGWANVWLKLEATRGALRLGIKTFRFTTFDQYTDTRSFTQRFGGETTRVMQLMYRPIASCE